jgi:DNA-binding IclR family transcriptional regulator
VEGTGVLLAERARDRAAPETTYRAPAVDRAFRILFLLRGRPDGLGVSEIARGIGIGKGPCFALLKTLEANEAVVCDRSRKVYHLGAALVRLGVAVSPHRQHLEVARREMERLALEVRLSCFVSVPYGLDRWISVAAAESTARVRTTIELGHCLPTLSAANGKALLAWRPRAAAEEMIRALGLPSTSPRAITDPAAFMRALERTRQIGYAESFGEFDVGVNVLAGPIFDASGEVVMILKTIGSETELPARRAPEVGRRLRRAVERITAAIGGTFPRGVK